MNLLRRSFITAAALAPVSCGIPLSYERGSSLAPPSPIPVVRPPQIGQEWTYTKKDVFDGKTLGIILERVSGIRPAITIDRFAENGAMLPSEIQASWGMASTSTQWPRVLHYSPALPLWPLELSSAWSKQFITKYSLSGYPDSKMNWQEYMSVQGWEKITVPAGVFIALRFETLIHFASEDPNKVNCIRKETVWFSPEIGRWVAREASGSYQIIGEVGPAILEGSYQWQLISYK